MGAVSANPDKPFYFGLDIFREQGLCVIRVARTWRSLHAHRCR